MEPCKHLAEVAKHLNGGGKNAVIIGKARYAVEAGKCSHCGNPAHIEFLKPNQQNNKTE